MDVYVYLFFFIQFYMLPKNTGDTAFDCLGAETLLIKYRVSSVFLFSCRRLQKKISVKTAM